MVTSNIITWYNCHSFLSFLKLELFKAAFYSLGLSHPLTTWWFTADDTMKLHWSLSWNKLILSTTSSLNDLSFILVLFSHLHKVWSGSLFPSDLPTKTLYYFPNSPMHTTWLIKLILILIQCGTLCKSWNSSVHIFIKLPVTCPPPHTHTIKIFSSAPCPQQPHCMFFLQWEINSHTHTIYTKNFTFPIFDKGL